MIQIQIQAQIQIQIQTQIQIQIKIQIQIHIYKYIYKYDYRYKYNSQCIHLLSTTTQNWIEFPHQQVVTPWWAAVYIAIDISTSTSEN